MPKSVNIRVKTPRSPDQSPPLWKRAASFLIDLVIVNVFMITPFWGLIRKSLPGTSIGESLSYMSAHPQVAFSLNMVSLFVMLAIMAYFVILEYVIGSTVGMLLLKIKVQTTHNNLHWWQFILRNLYLIPIFPFVLFWVIEPISLIWTKGEWRTLEKLSQTRLVQEAGSS